ncbi:MAG TPA: hypothetical protein VNS63_15810 [Blastocatellia bacterium]|nr:hypothetical protein [Blastocatellia bacterium]
MIALSAVALLCDIAMSETTGPSQRASEEAEIVVRTMAFSPDGSTLAIVRGDLKRHKNVQDEIGEQALKAATGGDTKPKMRSLIRKAALALQSQ